jgi:adenylosuccinate synthase
LHGTYPFVTSPVSTVAGSACTRHWHWADEHQIKVIGITKAYTTRVGSWPFSDRTEQDEVGQNAFKRIGHEFGSTTGTSLVAVVGLDLVALKYAIRLNGITNLALMKLDVLSGHDQIGICTAYKLNGETLTEFPTSAADLERVEPVIEYLPRLESQDITKVTQLKDLPRPTTTYIDFIGSQIGTPIDVISVGPGREQTLWVKPLFQGRNH